MQHHRWDTVDYRGHSCVVESEWDNLTEHWIMLRPTDIEGGVYVITEEQLTASSQDQHCMTVTS